MTARDVSPPQGGGNRILSAYGTSILGVFSGLLTNLWLISKVTKEVSPQIFGVYALAMQVISYINLLQLGLDFAAAQRIARSLGKGDGAAANLAFWELGRFSGKAGLAAMALSGAIAGGFWLGIGVSEPMRRVAAYTAILAGASTMVGFWAMRYGAALVGTQRQDYLNLIIVARSLAITVLAYGLLLAGTGILCLPIATLAMAFLSYSAQRALATRVSPWATANAPPRDPSALKALTSYGALASVNGLGWTVEATCDLWILAIFHGSEVVAVYVLWWRFPDMLFNFCSRLVMSAFPTFAGRHGAAGDQAARLLEKVGLLSAGLGTLALVGTGIWLPSFIHLWLGDGYSLPDGQVIALGMALLVLLRTMGNLLGMFWLSTGDASFPARLSWAQAVLKVAVGVALVGNFGISGMVVASCLASSLQVGVYAVALSARGLLGSRLVRRAGTLGFLAIVTAVAGSRMNFQVSLFPFVAGTLVTTLLWGLLWMGIAWQSELQPNLARLRRG